MTKKEKLDLVKVLSALESWSFSVNAMLPDYLSDGLSATINILTNEILEVEE